MSSTGEWLIGNLLLLQSTLPTCDIEFDGDEGTWVRIIRFPLPDNFQQRQTDLLLLLPGIDQPMTMQPRSFYLDQNLRSSLTGNTPAHIFDMGSYHGWQDLANQGYANFCLLLTQWNPTADVVSGDNLLTVVNAIYQHLSEL